MMKKRSGDLVASQILDICMNGAGKTKILYQANLNSIRVDQYLENLIRNRLISKVPCGSRVLYKTTHEGSELNLKFHQLQTEMNELRASLLDSKA